MWWRICQILKKLKILYVRYAIYWTLPNKVKDWLHWPYIQYQKPMHYFVLSHISWNVYMACSQLLITNKDNIQYTNQEKRRVLHACEIDHKVMFLVCRYDTIQQYKQSTPKDSEFLAEEQSHNFNKSLDWPISQDMTMLSQDLDLLKLMIDIFHHVMNRK